MTRFFLLCILFPLCSCASIVSKSSSPLFIDSNPSRAKVEISDRNGLTRFVGETPSTVNLPNGDGYFTKARYTIKVSKDGYDPSVTNLVADLNGWYFGNIFWGIGGLIGMFIIDPNTGAMFEFENGQVHANLPVSQDPRAALATALPPKEDDVLPSSEVTIEDKLLKLKKLKDDGLIDDKEFQSKKKQLLEKL